DKSALRAFFAQSLEEAAQLQESENLVKGSLLYYESLFKESSGDFSGALEKAKGSYGIRAKLLPAYSTDVASSLIRLSEAYLRLSRPAEAAAQAKRAYDEQERSAGKDSPIYAEAAFALASTYMAASQY